MTPTPAHRLLLDGARTLLAAPGLTLALCLVGGLGAYAVEAWVGPGVHAINHGDPGTRAAASLGALGLTALLALYLAFRLLFRALGSRPRRRAWLPTLLILPCMLLALSLSPALDNVTDEVAPAALGYAGAGLAWWMFGLGSLTTLWIALAVDADAHGGRPSAGRALGWWRTRWLDALAPLGGAVTVVFLGLQALWYPGLVYAVELGFVGQAALIDPERRPHRRSRALAQPAWTKVLALLVLGGLCVAVAQGVLLVVTETGLWAAGVPTYPREDGGLALGELLFSWAYAQVFAGAIRLPPLGVGLAGVTSAFLWGSVTVGLTRLYRERVAVRRGEASSPDVTG